MRSGTELSKFLRISYLFLSIRSFIGQIRFICLSGCLKELVIREYQVNGQMGKKLQ